MVISDKGDPEYPSNVRNAISHTSTIYDEGKK